MSQSALEIDMQEEGKEMSTFLTNSLRAQPKKVGEVMAKLQSATVSYEDLLTLSDVLKGIDNLSPLHVGRIISSLKTIEDSTIFKESQQETMATSPQTPGGFFKIYVSPEETRSFHKLSKALNITSDAAVSIQSALKQLEENRVSTLKAIDTAFNTLTEDLAQRKSALRKETNDVAQKKQNVLNEQLENLMKYEQTLQSAEAEYHRTLENPELHDIDRKDKNLTDIEKAINGPNQYMETTPQIYPEIAFLFDDQYAEIVDRLRDFGEVIGSMRAPEIAITEIKSYGCVVTILPHDDSSPDGGPIGVGGLILEKYEIRYEGEGASGQIRGGGGGGNETDDGNDEDEKITLNEGDVGVDTAMVEMDHDDESVSIIGLKPETEYRFSARAIYSHGIITHYSEGIFITTPKAKRSVFCF